MDMFFEVQSIRFADKLAVGSELRKEIKKDCWFGIFRN